MNKTLYNLHIKTTKVYAIHMSGEMQPNKIKAVCNTHISDKYNQTKPVETMKKYVISLLLFVIHVYIDIVHIC